MWGSDSDPELAAASSSTTTTTTTTTVSASASPPPSPPPASLRRSSRRRRRRRQRGSSAAASQAPEEEAPEAEDVWRGAQWEAAWPARRQHARPVLLAGVGAGDGGDDGGVGRSRSLTDDDLEELRGCADLGFGFSYDEIPELRGTLPALELCYSMSQRLLDLDDSHHHARSDEPAAPSPPAPPVTNWKISSPGDSPDEVKARLKYWAQAVACTVRLCS